MNEQTKAAITELQALFDDRLTTHQGLLKEHGEGEAFYPTTPPDAVLYPHSTEEVSEAVGICAKHAVPIIPYGAGTSTEGHCLAVRGGICFDFSQMNNVLRVSSDDLDCTVQAGVTRKQLNNYLRETGLMFPIDPGADATLGGMCATSASGTNAVRYGTMKDMVISLKAVMANGDIIETASRAKKTSAGYDLTHLLVGSEGTLGIITEVTLRLVGQPDTIIAGMCSFPSVEDAVQTTIQTIQYGLQVGRIELLDAALVKAINEYFNTSFSEQPTLWYEFSGTPDAVDEQVAIFNELTEGQNGTLVSTARSLQERDELWEKRHKAWDAFRVVNPGYEGWSTDVCVPISNLANCVEQARLALEKTDLHGAIVGHVGDGNFHVLILIDPENEQQIIAAKALNTSIVETAQSLDGTCTGEHGIGLGKIDHLEKELPSAIPVMRSIKQALDPNNILNPGKILR